MCGAHSSSSGRLWSARTHGRTPNGHQGERELAHGARSRAQADIGLSIARVAKPSRETSDKPVGVMYVGLADHAGVEVVWRTWGDHLSQTRPEIRDRSVKAALSMLRLRLLSDSEI